MRMANRNVLDHLQFRLVKGNCLLKNNRFKTNEDRISDLPDEILSNILARLTLKEAVATSILSKRWTDVWTSYPFLDFELFKDIYYPEILVDRVNNIVEKYNGTKLHKFRIVHWMSDRFKSHIDKWISFATQNRVSELELHFGGRGIPDGFDYYWVPLHVFAREEMMISNRSSLNVVRSFVSLRDLRLGFINFTDQVFDIILYNCSSLETFHLTNNFGLVNAKNTAPHLKLKSLELYYCYDLKQLELLAPNLVSFKYTGRERYLCIKDAQQLVSLSISIATNLEKDDVHPIFPREKNLIFNQLSSYFPKLESLSAPFTLFEDMTNLTELCVFSNLKTLALDATYLFSIQRCCQVAAFIISAAPYLELLELNLKTALASLTETVALELSSMSTHVNLKEVKVTGFRADVYAMDFLGYLVECSVSLQKISLTARQTLSSDDAESCKMCVQELRKVLNTNVQLIFQDY